MTLPSLFVSVKAIFKWSMDVFARNKISPGNEIKKTYTSSQLIPILKAEGLFKSSRHQGLLRELRAMIFLSSDEYDRFYQTTLNQFAEFVQVLPVVMNGSLSGLLNEGVARAVIAIKYYISEHDHPDPLFAYALFTAALFLDIAKVLTNYYVILSTKEGAFVDYWHPLEGSMVEKADSFKIYPLAPIYQRLERPLTQLLAQQVMPREGFLWIASDLNLYADWLEALGGDSGQAGTLAHLISLLPKEEITNLLNGLVQVPISLQEGKMYPYGELFYEWLTEGIASGEIAVNTADAGVHVVADGVFLERNKLYHHFAQVCTLPVNINIVFAQFGNLFGIVEKGGADFLHAQYFSKYQAGMGNKGLAFSSPLNSMQRTTREGVLISNPAVIFTKTAVPAVTDSLKATQDYTALSHRLPGAVESLSIAPKNK